MLEIDRKLAEGIVTLSTTIRRKLLNYIYSMLNIKQKDLKKKQEKKIILKGNQNNRKLNNISKITHIDPNYISGLTQSDGSFFVTISKNKKSKWGIRIRPTFTITQNLDSLSVLESIKHFFNCGYITIIKEKNAAEYKVTSKEDLQIIFKHFETYPLYESKQRSMHIVKEITNILIKEEHYEKIKLAYIIKLIFTINPVTNRTKEKELFQFLELNYIEKINYSYVFQDYPLNENFIMGLIDGDGSFYVSFHFNKLIKTGFSIVQYSTEIKLLEKIQKYFNCGTIYKVRAKPQIKYQITSLKDICSILIPFVDKYQLHTMKKEHYLIFKKVCEIKNQTIKLSDKEKLYIIDIAYNMNKEGRGRHLTKDEYIKKYFLS